MGSNPTEVKFSLTRGDSQISFKRGIPKGDLVYRQYCLLPAPKHILKIIIAYFPGATRFPYYISIPALSSPVPELSLLPFPYRGWTRAGERRVQDNLHAHAQNAAIFPPNPGKKPYLVVFSRFGLWRDFVNDNIQAIISVFRLIKNMSINPKSVEFHQYHAKPHSICFLSQYQR